MTHAAAYMLTDTFRGKFVNFCQMETIPDISLQQMKIVKSDFIERVVTPEVTDSFGNAARLMASWVDGALEFTVLKHEVIVLRMKSNKVHERIREVSSMWPRKKEFIEGAYKILLFTKNQRRQVNYTINALRERGRLGAPWDYKDAINRVLKKWYEERIQEETERNRTLKLLHDGLTRIKELREAQNMRQLEYDRIELLEEVCRPRLEIDGLYNSEGVLINYDLPEIPRKIELRSEIQELQVQLDEAQRFVDETQNEQARK